MKILNLKSFPGLSRQMAKPRKTQQNPTGENYRTGIKKESLVYLLLGGGLPCHGAKRHHGQFCSVCALCPPL